MCCPSFGTGRSNRIIVVGGNRHRLDAAPRERAPIASLPCDSFLDAANPRFPREHAVQWRRLSSIRFITQEWEKRRQFGEMRN